MLCESYSVECEKRVIMHIMKFSAAVITVCVATFVVSPVYLQNVPADIFLLDATNSTGNVTVSRDCRQRNEFLKCPDPEILFYLYSGNNGEAEKIDVTDSNWLKNSRYNPDLPTVLLVHGYRGGESLPPLVVLKNAYIKRGEHNLIMLDWGALARVPCFVQALGSLKAVAKCTAHLYSYLEARGVRTETITCVGHSMGAHICGILANYAPKKMEKIIGLDPSRPLMNIRLNNAKLDSKDAKIVQVIHSNAGFYGQTDVIGTVDFCVNNGLQPYCRGTRNEQLCSHLHAVCYMAHSLDKNVAFQGTSCNSKCPFGTAAPMLPPLPAGIPRKRKSVVYMGAHMENSASGTYCVENSTPPYCLNPDIDPDYGDKRCCPVYPENKNAQRTEEEIESALFMKAQSLLG